MEQKMQWSENVILVDADFLDSLVQDFITNFERMINRPLGKLDLCHWLDCLLLDVEVKEGEHDNFVAFLHKKGNKGLKFVNPGDFKEFLSEKAFKDRLGEFSLGSFPIEDIVSRGEFMNDALKAAMESDKTQHILVIADMDAYGTQICKTANGETKAQVTLFTMRLIPSGKYKQQILGYSVMSGLGIRSDELK
ncbi:MAG: hypothetical protein II530_02440 [Bacteroidaceae bacterium]|nr:hypothetical protein [Bacteroidaceae bacterium]